MDVLTLLTSVVLVVGAFALVLYPLWQQTRPDAIFKVERSGQTGEEYQARYHAALAAIKDLMFDYEMGKVSEDDYETLLAKAKLEAAAIRHQLDRFNHSTTTDMAAALEVEIEKLVAQLRSSKFNGHAPLLSKIDAEIELLKTVSLSSAISAELFCPQCGQSVLIDDAFCTACGQALPQANLPQPPHSPVSFCSSCGQAIQPEDAFCAGCGAAVVKRAQSGQSEEVITG